MTDTTTTTPAPADPRPTATAEVAPVVPAADPLLLATFDAIETSFRLAHQNEALDGDTFNRYRAAADALKANIAAILAGR